MLESRGTKKFGSNSSSIGSSTLSLDPLSLGLGIDPLSQVIGESDPLSQMAAEYVTIFSTFYELSTFLNFVLFKGVFKQTENGRNSTW